MLSLPEVIRMELSPSLFAVSYTHLDVYKRQIVNKANPNSHKGMIYCSNLCTEIAQNMSPVESVSTEILNREGDTVIVNTTRPGDFVVCNLASLCLGNIDGTSDREVVEIVSTAVRALDNVIDLNFYPLPYAKVTNRRYRSIGLGVSGYHHMLAKHRICLLYTSCIIRWDRACVCLTCSFKSITLPSFILSPMFF